MHFTPQDWHRRFTQQALWTKDLRDYLLQRAGLEDAKRVLEVGCGTGAILADLGKSTAAGPGKDALESGIYGLDIDGNHLEMAMRNSAQGQYTLGDPHTLPYPASCFDLTFCHFLLLWVSTPLQTVKELARVTRPGGAVLALAEPDYGGRIDFPNELIELGRWQSAALREQGADPLIGRKLADIFQQAGLESVETGVLGGQWSGPPVWEAWESEWAVLASDLKEKPSFLEKLGSLKTLDKSAYQQGKRVLFVPTFYAWGKVTSSPR